MKATIAVFATFLIASGALAQRDASPFTHEEATLMSTVWPKIREADSFDDINWRASGLRHAPGDYAAQRYMAEHWDALRRAAAFDEIDWRTTSKYSSYPSWRAKETYGFDTGPFTPEDAEAMRRVWPAIREADAFGDIDWRKHGLRRAPGDSAARRIMASNWGTLREASSFEDIDWRNVR